MYVIHVCHVSCATRNIHYSVYIYTGTTMKGVCYSLLYSGTSEPREITEVKILWFSVWCNQEYWLLSNVV